MHVGNSWRSHWQSPNCRHTGAHRTPQLLPVKNCPPRLSACWLAFPCFPASCSVLVLSCSCDPCRWRDFCGWCACSCRISKTWFAARSHFAYTHSLANRSCSISPPPSFAVVVKKDRGGIIYLLVSSVWNRGFLDGNSWSLQKNSAVVWIAEWIRISVCVCFFFFFFFLQLDFNLK